MASCIRIVMCSVDPYFQRQHKVTIPPLQCSQPMHLHPKFESIREETNSWLLSVTQPATKEAAKLVVQTQIPLLVCGAYANAQDERHCSAVAKFMAWTFMMDDVLDVLKSETPFSISLGANWDSVLEQKGATNGGKESLITSLKKTFDEGMDTKGMQWWREMKEIGMSPSMERRFMKSFAQVMEEQNKQTGWREAKHMAGIKGYVETRRIGGGYPLLMMLSEWCMGVEVGEEIERNELLWELYLASNDHVCWLNDLLSLKWEYSNGDLSNLPTLLCHHLRQAPAECLHDNLFQTSVDMVQLMVQKRDHDFTRLLCQAYDSPSFMATPGMPLYLRALANWMSGHHRWCYATARYHGLDLPHPLPLHAPLTYLLSPPPPPPAT